MARRTVSSSARPSPERTAAGPRRTRLPGREALHELPVHRGMQVGCAAARAQNGRWRHGGRLRLVRPKATRAPSRSRSTPPVRKPRANGRPTSAAPPRTRRWPRRRRARCAGAAPAPAAAPAPRSPPAPARGTQVGSGGRGTPTVRAGVWNEAYITIGQEGPASGSPAGTNGPVRVISTYTGTLPVDEKNARTDGPVALYVGGTGEVR